MIDLKIDENGELVLAANGDLEIITGDDQVAQEVLVRLKTTKGDSLTSPNMGCDLEAFIGAPNTPLVHSLIEQQIENALTYDGLLIFPQIDVTDISPTEIFILIEFNSIDGEDRTIQVQSQLDLKKGLVFSRIMSVPL